jgi:hypothetical protein
MGLSGRWFVICNYASLGTLLGGWLKAVMCLSVGGWG